jgi:hypothetical protein
VNDARRLPMLKNQFSVGPITPLQLVHLPHRRYSAPQIGFLPRALHAALVGLSSSEESSSVCGLQGVSARTDSIITVACLYL